MFFRIFILELSPLFGIFYPKSYILKYNYIFSIFNFPELMMDLLGMWYFDSLKLISVV